MFLIIWHSSLAHNLVQPFKTSVWGSKIWGSWNSVIKKWQCMSVIVIIFFIINLETQWTEFCGTNILLFSQSDEIKRRRIMHSSYLFNIIFKSDQRVQLNQHAVCVCTVPHINLWLCEFLIATHRWSRWLKVSADYWFPAEKLLKVSQLILAGWTRCR